MTVIAVLDWMTPVMNVPAITPLIGVPAILASSARILLTASAWMPLRHEFEAEHEDAQAADHRHEDVLEDIRLHKSPHRGRIAAPRPCPGRINRRYMTVGRQRLRARDNSTGLS